VFRGFITPKEYMSRISRISAAVAAAAVALVSLSSPAQAAGDTGLFGAGDPTYNGVFRQANALTALVSAKAKPSAASIAWLLEQQCADGSFQEYRANISDPCGPSDGVNFTGPDTNATAAAALALAAVDHLNSLPAGTRVKVERAWARANAWLTKHQNSDGGWPFYLGTASDANSTGLVMAALRTAVVDPSRPGTTMIKGARYLSSIALPCGSTDGGALPFQAGGKADGSASSQGLFGLTAVVPITKATKFRATPSCTGSITNRVASYLATQLAATGALTSSMDGSADYTSTALALTDLAALGVAKPAVTRALATLKAATPTYSVSAGATNPGAVALLIGAAVAGNANPRNFGGTNLVTLLQGSERK